MILIIADQGDLPAQWLQAMLRQRLPVPVELLSPAQLVYAPAIIQRLATEGGQSGFRLWNGVQFDFASVSGVINRITSLPLEHLGRAEQGDQGYAAGELHAFLLGWLASLECPVLNPPAPEWLAGPWHSEISALHLAAQAGLRGEARLLDPSSEGARLLVDGAGAGEVHFVLDDQLIGPVVDVRHRDSLIAFAHGWGARLLQVETRKEGGERWFLRATSLPDYRLGGSALVHAITRVFGT